MTYRTALSTRFWLGDREYDLLTSDTILHYDLFAYVDSTGAHWFLIEARQGGKVLVATELYRLDESDGRLEARHAVPQWLPVVWNKATHKVFRWVHRALLSRCVMLPGYNRKSVHCHYVYVPDCDPWPRGTVNSFSYGGVKGGIAQGKPQRTRRQPRDVVPTPAGALPDWL